MMRAFGIFMAVVVAIAVIGFVSYGGAYNTIVAKNEAVGKCEGQVQNVYQRRADLVPNLVEITKGYAKHESDLFSKVAEAQAKIGQVNVNAGELLKTPEGQKQFFEAQNSFGGTVSRILSLQQAYPNLKADQAFLKLQDELAGTENRIAVERKRWQESIEDYNGTVKGFWSGWIADRNGYKPRDYFKADVTAQKAPTVKF